MTSPAIGILFDEPVPDPTGDWLEHLYAGVEQGWVTLFAIDRTTGDRHVRWANVDRLGDLADHAHQLADTCCVWFGVATRRKNLGNLRGGVDDCELIPCLWVDVDVAGPNHVNDRLPATLDDAHGLLEQFPLAPTAITHTGGGLQAFWLLQEPVAPDRHLLERWGATWAEIAERNDVHIDNVFNADRVMRLPGTTNRKTTPVDVEVASAHWHRRYGLDDIDRHLHDPPEPVVQVVERSAPYIGPERPGDAFNVAANCHDVLTSVGFHSPRNTRNGVDYVRPGKDRKQGYAATVYADDGHCTIWSDTCASRWPGLKLRRPYDPFGLYAALHHASDWQAATKALAAIGYGEPRQPIDLSWIDDANADDPQTTPAKWLPILLPSRVDWAELWAKDRTATDWLIEPIIAKGRSHAVYAGAKTGKSLILLWAVASASLGRPTLDQPAGAPPTVVYFDMEMTEDDLAERLDDMGHEGRVFEHFHHYLLPALPPLDTPDGGEAVMEVVAYHNADIVIVDTTSRAVEGAENDADTIRAYYRHTGMRLKAAGMTAVRVDHSGKDATKGQRGTSAKNDDVDVVWRVERRDDANYRFVCTHKRMGWVPEMVELAKTDWPLTFDITEGKSLPVGSKGIAAEMDTLNIDVSLSQRSAVRAFRQAGGKGDDKAIRAAQRWRQQAAATDWIEGA